MVVQLNKLFSEFLFMEISSKKSNTFFQKKKLELQG
jgi:hypothetical protein